MQTVKIQTTQNIDIDYEVAGLGERILARLIDSGLFIALAIIEVIAYSFAPSKTVLIYVLVITYLVVYVFYDVLCEIFLNGQSFGKRIMKIRVISMNGARPSLSQYLLRWLFRIVDFTLTSQICALVCVAASDNKQRVGDMVAGTTLIKTSPRTTYDQIIFNQTPPDYEPVFSQASQLTDNEVTLMKEVLYNFKVTGNNLIVYNMALKIKELLGITIPQAMNEHEFLLVLLKDYEYYLMVTGD